MRIGIFQGILLPGIGLSIVDLQNSALIPIPFPFFDAGALVIQFLASRECNFAFDPVIFPVQGKGDTGVTLLGGGIEESGQFLAV